MEIEPEGVAFVAVIAFMVGVAVGLLIGEFPARHKQAGYPERMADNTPTFQAEPVAVESALRNLLVAVIGLLQVFGAINWTPEQQGAVLLVFAALSVAASLFVRNKVTPTPSTPPADRGESLIAVLVVAVAMIVCVWLIVTKS